jgi:hypothetical protein
MKRNQPSSKKRRSISATPQLKVKIPKTFTSSERMLSAVEDDRSSTSSINSIKSIKSTNLTNSINESDDEVPYHESYDSPLDDDSSAVVTRTAIRAAMATVE